jgi:hypothetical protein
VREKKSIRITGGNAEAVRFFAIAQPKVVSKKKHLIGKQLWSQSKIVSIEHVNGESETFNLETTSNNFIADGFVTHNCCKNHNRVRLRSAGKVIEEVTVLNEQFKFQALAFPEDIFILDRDRTAAVCDFLRRRRIIWRCLVRADMAVRYGADFIEMLAASGCVDIGMGVESGSERILKGIDKGETAETILKAIRMIQGAGIRVKGFFIIGLPGESLETLAETDRFLAEAKLDDIDCKIYQPYPGSPIYDQRQKYDIHWRDTPLEHSWYKGRAGEYHGSISTSALTTAQIVEAWKDLESRYKRSAVGV